ncbi:MAG: phosphoribosyltransferase family protein [Patescibacteria group bacterium]|nr:phosphoribosyltransferase family protein [Patescibacteria group bacterium]
MDEILAKAIVDLQVPFFGKSLKNKGDSRSCLFRARRLLSSPKILKHAGKRIARIVSTQCEAKTLMGVVSSGLPWAAAASIYSGLPMMYVRKKLELHMSNQMIEGIEPKIKKVIMIDDLMFAGESKNEFLEILAKEGYQVTDIIVVIDRQLQRKKDGLAIQDKWHLKLHRLITMDEIVNYMEERQLISKEQLSNLIKDYRKFERWDMPSFAK